MSNATLPIANDVEIAVAAAGRFVDCDAIWLLVARGCLEQACLRDPRAERADKLLAELWRDHGPETEPVAESETAAVPSEEAA